MKLIVMSLCALLGMQSQAHIYHDKWIDFNKNGKKDIYLNSADKKQCG
jgi:hypothetical protein